MEDAEAAVVRRIRILVGLVGTLGAIAIACGYLPGLTITDAAYRRFVVLAGGDRLALFVAVALLPGGAVLRAPTWTPILTWIVWAAGCSVILFGHLLIWRQEMGPLEFMTPEPALLGVACCLAMGAIVVAIAIPCARRKLVHRPSIEVPIAHLR
ncbi:MAG: hypothetical protein NT062_27510 [Proteobacteria bacterium]|nr:hypothetical protein [Pseudomonadota bacterium]